MFKFIATAVTLTMFCGLAAADGHDHDHDNRRDDHRERGPAVHEQRNNQPQRVNRPAQRPDRRVISRRPVYVTNGRFQFVGGSSHGYTRPVIRTHYYDARVRPQLMVENYGSEPGYIWVRGQWTWSGREWVWGDGHFVPDPQYSNYYDDGSYDYSANISIGG
jgi:hypothetical protein